MFIYSHRNDAINSQDEKKSDVAQPRSTSLDNIKRYPMEEWYRLIVDGRFHRFEQGWVGYHNREPGSLKAVFDALAVAISNINDKVLTVDFIKQLHTTCTTNVKNLPAQLKPGEFRKQNDEIACHSMIGGFATLAPTLEGVVRLLDYIESQDEFPEESGPKLRRLTSINGQATYTYVDRSTILQAQEYSGIKNNLLMAQKLLPVLMEETIDYVAPEAGETLNQKIQAITDSYNEAIQEAKDQDTKLKVIVDHVYEFEHMHPFYDANTRTFTIALMTRLLVQNGFPPATLRDANLFFDVCSKESLYQKIKRAIQTSLDIIAGQKEIFSFCSSTIPLTYQKQYPGMVNVFLNTLEKEYHQSTASKIEAQVRHIKSYRYTLFKNQLAQGEPESGWERWLCLKKSEGINSLVLLQKLIQHHIDKLRDEKRVSCCERLFDYSKAEKIQAATALLQAVVDLRETRVTNEDGLAPYESILHSRLKDLYQLYLAEKEIYSDSNKFECD